MTTDGVTPTKHIVIAEDDTELRTALATALRELGGYAVTETDNGQDAVNEALAKHPDLVILDVQMPQKLGTEALAEIRADAWGQTVPIIMLTVESELEQVSQAIKIGGHKTSYLTKHDWSLHEVVAQVKKATGDA